jgi:hypothetical protein
MTISSCSRPPSSRAATRTTGSPTASCLDAGQVGALRKIFAGARNARGEELYAGFVYDAGVGDPSRPASRRADRPGDLAPTRGGPGDPRTGGGTLFVYNSSGSGEAVRIPLPPSGWTAKGNALRPTGYDFKAAEKGDPVKLITIRNDKLLVKGGRDLFAYSLDEPSQGRIALRLTLGTDAQWCAEATGRQDEVDEFIAVVNTPTPAICPAL